MISQPELFDAQSPKVDPTDVAEIMAALQGSGWRTAAQLGAQTESLKRRLRAIANASGGHILSYPGSPGYRLTREATIAEIQTATAKLRHQAAEMAQRALEIDRVYHAKL